MGLEELPERWTLLSDFASLDQVISQVDQTDLSLSASLGYSLLDNQTHQHRCEAGSLATDLANQRTGTYDRVLGRVQVVQKFLHSIATSLFVLNVSGFFLDRRVLDFALFRLLVWCLAVFYFFNHLKV